MSSDFVSPYVQSPCLLFNQNKSLVVMNVLYIVQIPSIWCWFSQMPGMWLFWPESWIFLQEFLSGKELPWSRLCLCPRKVFLQWVVNTKVPRLSSISFHDHPQGPFCFAIPLGRLWPLFAPFSQLNLVPCSAVFSSFPLGCYFQ